MALYRMKNSVQHYSWGSPSLLPELLGIRNPEAEPWAELWMGAHPRNPSMVETESGPVPLNDFIAKGAVTSFARTMETLHWTICPQPKNQRRAQADG